MDIVGSLHTLEYPKKKLITVVSFALINTLIQSRKGLGNLSHLGLWMPPGQVTVQ